MNRANALLVGGIALAIIAVVMNLRDPSHSVPTGPEEESQPVLEAEGEDEEGHENGHEQEEESDEARVAEPTVIGAADAKVRISVYAGLGNVCHAESVHTMRAVAEALPDRIRVEFIDTSTDAGMKATEDAGIHCETGMLINGENEVEIEKDGKTRSVGLHGPVGMETPAEYVRLALEQELTKQYGDAVSDEELEKLRTAWTEACNDEESGGGMGDESVEQGTPTTEEGKAAMKARLMQTELADLLKSSKPKAKAPQAKPAPK